MKKNVSGHFARRAIAGAVFITLVGNTAAHAAILYYTGGSSGSSVQMMRFSSNWSLTDGGTTATLPTSSDSVVIDSVRSGQTTTTSVGGGSGGRLAIDGNMSVISMTIGNSTGAMLPSTLYIDNSYYSQASAPGAFTLALNGDGTATDDLLTLTNAVTSNVEIRGAAYAGASTSNMVFTLGAGSIDVVNSAATLTISNQITTSAGITKTGAGTLVISNTSNTSTVTGGINANGGIISFSSFNALGAASNTVTYNGGTLQDTATTTTGSSSRNFALNGNGTFEMTNAAAVATLSGNITGTGSFTKTGAGTVVLSGGSGNTFSGGLHINAGTVEISTTGSLGSATTGADVTMEAGTTLRDTTALVASTSRQFALNGNATLEMSNAAGALTISGAITGAGGLNKIGPGTLVLSGGTANTFSGGTTVSAGVLEISNVNSLGSTSAGNGLTLAGGTLRDTTTLSTAATGRLVNITSASTIEMSSSTGMLTMSGTVSGAGGLTKIGTGTLALSGTQSYAGTTSVSAGALLLNGTYSGGTVSVASGATLGGTGTATGVSNSGTVSAGGTAAVGTFAVSSLSGAGAISTDIDGATSDLLNVNGLLDLTGATLSFNSISTPTAGVYVFAKYGTLTGTGTISGLPAGYTVDYNYQGLNQIALVPEPAMLGVLGIGAVGLLRRRKSK